MRLKLISCEVFYREMCAAVARSTHQVDLEFLPKGLHDIGRAGMQQRLQAVLDRVDETLYEAVLFGYGLCNLGLAGLTARAIPLVVPRAHDCITLLLGSKERYLAYFNENPGTYFKSSGWIERGAVSGELTQLSVPHRQGMMATYEELVAKYGEDNARFLHEELGNHARNYCRFAFIRTGVEPDARFENQTRTDAAQRGWGFDKIDGDLSLIQRLVDGTWNETEFLIVPPGSSITPSFDESIIRLTPPPPTPALP